MFQKRHYDPYVSRNQIAENAMNDDENAQLRQGGYGNLEAAMNADENAQLRQGPVASQTPVATLMSRASGGGGGTQMPYGDGANVGTGGQTGSITDFAAAMRAVSKSAYEYRQKKDKKITGKQFDASRVSGSVFRNIMTSVEENRGGGISKMYGSAVDATKTDIQNKQNEKELALKAQEMQFKIEKEKRDALKEVEDKTFEVLKMKQALNIDAVYIPPSSGVSFTNNNPGNLTFNSQSGAVQGEPKVNSQGQIIGYWAKFSSPEAGFQALVSQINLDQSKGQTLSEFVSRYVPAGSDANALITLTANQLGVTPDTNISEIDTQKLAEHVAKNESGSEFIAKKEAVVDKDTVSSWVARIQEGSDKITSIPASQAALRNEVSKGLLAAGNSTEGKPTTTELGKAALVSAKSLKEKFDKGIGTSAVGGSRAAGGAVAGMIPGTDAFNFSNEFETLSGQLQLEGVKYLKGQGAVSDAERAILKSAVTKLKLSQSEEEFKTTLQQLIDKLEGNLPGEQKEEEGGSIVMTSPTGKKFNVPSNQINLFKQNGYK